MTIDKQSCLAAPMTRCPADASVNLINYKAAMSSGSCAHCCQHGNIYVCEGVCSNEDPHQAVLMEAATAQHAANAEDSYKSSA